MRAATLIACLGIFSFGFLAGRESRTAVLDRAARALYVCGQRVDDARNALRRVNSSLELRLNALRNPEVLENADQ